MRRKPVVFSKIFKFILMVIIALGLMIGMLSLGVPKWITFSIIIILYILYTAAWPAHIIYRTKSIARVDRYVKNNAFQIIFDYPNALREGNPQKIETALKRIIGEFPDMKHLYGAHLSAHQKDPQSMITHAEEIEDLDYKNFYMAYANILKGHYADALEYEKKVEVPWMVNALKAYEANQRGETLLFQEEAKKAVEKAGGVQKYTIFYTLKNLASPDDAFLDELK